MKVQTEDKKKKPKIKKNPSTSKQYKQLNQKPKSRYITPWLSQTMGTREDEEPPERGGEILTVELESRGNWQKTGKENKRTMNETDGEWPQSAEEMWGAEGKGILQT